MNKEDSIIFLTDKYGKRDRTTEIENLTYDNVKGIWNIDFVGDQRTFHYKNGEEDKPAIESFLVPQNEAGIDVVNRIEEFKDAIMKYLR